MEQRFSSMQLDALREVSNIGVGNAATSLSTLLGTKIDMSVPSVNMVELSSIINESGENAVLGIGQKEYAEKQVMYLCADISDLKRDTGFEPVYSFEQGIKETINWYKEFKNKE